MHLNEEVSYKISLKVPVFTYLLTWIGVSALCMVVFNRKIGDRRLEGIKDDA